MEGEDLAKITQAHLNKVITKTPLFEPIDYSLGEFDTPEIDFE